MRRRLSFVVTLAALATLSPAPAAAAPALWSVTKGHATVYLFGTAHLARPDSQWRTPALDSALKASQRLWLEMQEAQPSADALALVQKFGLDPAHPLPARLSAAQKEKLAAILSAYGLPEAAVAPMKPWLAAVTISLLPLRKAGLDPKAGADAVLRDAAKAAGKPVDGFDTREEQIRYLADLPEADQLSFLDDALARSGAGADLPLRVAAAWEKGDVAALDAIINAELKQRSPLLYRRLLVERNRRYAQRIAAMLEGREDQLVAVGVGHLVGADSIEAMLERTGAKVRRIQ